MASGRVCYIYLFPLKQVFMESLLRAGRAGDKAANETQGWGWGLEINWKETTGQ